MRLKKDDRGVSLVLVISVIAIVTILVTIALAIGLFNYQMKITNRGSKDNFYDAEQVLDEIRLGLQKDVSDAMSQAYYETLEEYAGKDLEKATDYFNELYVDALRKTISGSQGKSYYDIDHLLSFLDEEVKNNTTLTTADNKKPILNVNKKDGLVLKNLSLTYVNEQDYISGIRTDIQLKIPDINLSKSNTGSSIVGCSLIAQGGITVEAGTGTVTFDGDVYAGTDTKSNRASVTVENGKTVNITEGKRLVVKDTLAVQQGGSMNMGRRSTLWTNDVEVANAAKLQLLGTSYVANDLTLLGGADVTIGGEYYGYGNPKAALRADSIKDLGIEKEIDTSPSDYSSAIIINGIGAASKAKLNLKDVTKLMLAGNAYVGDSKVLMGESLTAKSNQIAYLVPESCMMGASNPMTELTRVQSMGLESGDTAAVRAEKETAYKNQLLMQVRNTVSPDVEEIVQMFSRDGLYYYYMQFSSAKAADRYFAQHYQSAASGKIKDYLQYYVEDREINVNAGAGRELNGNILIYDENGISAIGDTIAEGTEDIAQTGSMANQLAGYQDIFHALNTNLSMNYRDLSKDVKSRETVYGNLVDENYYLWIAGSMNYFYYYEGDDIYVAKPHLSGGGNSYDRLSSILRTANHYGKLKVVFNDRDIVIDCDFDGLIITKGRAIIRPDTSNGTELKLSSDPVIVSKLIEEGSGYMANEDDVRLKSMMYNPEEYMGKFVKAGSRSDNYIEVEELVVYANWSKQ